MVGSDQPTTFPELKSILRFMSVSFFSQASGLFAQFVFICILRIFDFFHNFAIRKQTYL